MEKAGMRTGAQESGIATAVVARLRRAFDSMAAIILIAPAAAAPGRKSAGRLA